MHKILLNITEVSEQIGISEANIRRYLKAGEFPLPRQKGRIVRWLPSEVSEWAQNLPTSDYHLLSNDQ